MTKGLLNQVEGVTVAIVTARQNTDTTYDKWRELRSRVLGAEAGPDFHHVNGEFKALVAACLGSEARSHVEYQLRALALQTVKPSRVLIVSRHPYPEIPFDDRRDRDAFQEVIPDELLSVNYGLNVRWVEPLYSTYELERAPFSAATHLTRQARSTAGSFGCSDKNTALVLCRTKHLVMLDDCCLPGFGLVEAALKACSQGKVLLLKHKAFYLPTAERTSVEMSDANTDLDVGHIVFGVFAAPVQFLVDINGWNTKLDGQRGGLDECLKLRMDRYVKMRELEYVLDPAATVYEVEHGYPWPKEELSPDWQALVPEGYKAPGPNLHPIRDYVQAALAAEEAEDAKEEEDVIEYVDE